ncbi:protein phosphatase CheZ [Thiomicrospira sp. ALE5]|uniref:protein phosphatase CheZ n=1 Tax=Thiomicrospira sp. ALE5 TaxID=748650 RepID=UPI0008E5BB7E|nr:protein phosphatase CheZ [Thiomicrospira sp. ALE5]SFR59115.1 chemotaxis protein CheZ [Thiomicrospira sp. ALE5]
MNDANAQNNQKFCDEMISLWRDQLGDQQLQWLEAYDYLFNRSQDAANEVLEVCEQLQSSLTKEDAMHLAIQKIIQAQEFADLHGQLINRLKAELLDQHQKMSALLGEFNIAERDEGSNLAHGVGPNITQRSKKDSVSSQQEADDLLAQLGL